LQIQPNTQSSWTNVTFPDLHSPPFDPLNTLLMFSPQNYTKRAINSPTFGAYQYFPTNHTRVGQVAAIRLKAWANTKYATYVDRGEVAAMVMAFTQNDDTIADGYVWDFGLAWTLGRIVVNIPCDVSLKGSVFTNKSMDFA